MNAHQRNLVMLIGMALVIGFAVSTPTLADTSLSKGDQAFVAKVSQGGMFEVAASKVAEDRAQDVKDQAATEVHDHELVGAKLKSIASSNSADLPAELNADFSARVAKLGALSGNALTMPTSRK